MAAPTNNGEWDMATEDFCLSLSPLLSPRWSPPQAFLPLSNSMGNQSMAGDSALLQQQLRKNWSEASTDWKPRGGGLMTMNNQGFKNRIWVSISLRGPQISLGIHHCQVFFFVSSNIKDIRLAFSYQHILEDKSGALHVLNGEERRDIIGLLIHGFTSYLEKKFGYLDQIAKAADVLPLVDNVMDVDYDEREVTLRRINWLEQHDEDIVDQPVFKVVTMAQQLIQNRGGKLDVIFGGGVVTVNWLKRSNSRGSPTTPSFPLECGWDTTANGRLSVVTGVVASTLAASQPWRTPSQLMSW